MEVKNLVIINDFNYVEGGASKVAIDTAKLLKEDINVYFFSAVNKEEDNIEGIHYIATNQMEALKEKNKVKGAINGIYNFKAKKELKKLLETLDKTNTIIHVHGWTKALSSSIFDIAFKMKFKVVLTLHDYFTACPNGGYFNYKRNSICHLKALSSKCIRCNCDSRNYWFKVYRIIRQFVQNKIVRLNNRLENVISISDLNERLLRPELGKNVKMERIYNPIEKENEEKVDFRKNKYYLCVGRVSKEKGVELFCEAITQLGYIGVVVGDGEEKEKLEKIYTNIEFVGWKGKEDVKKYMKGAKALIFPSICYEAAPLTPLEIMRYGIPSLVSDVSAATEYVLDDNRIFKLDVQDLKKKILWYEQNIEYINIKETEHIEKATMYKINIKNYYSKILKG